MQFCIVHNWPHQEGYRKVISCTTHVKEEVYFWWKTNLRLVWKSLKANQEFSPINIIQLVYRKQILYLILEPSNKESLKSF